MAHHDYLIRYSNGFKRHVSRQERDILSASLKQIGSREYLCTLSLQMELGQSQGPSYLAGQFVFELRGKKRREVMQSTAGMVRALEQTGVLQAELSEASA